MPSLSYRLLDLSFVGLDLLLQLVDRVLVLVVRLALLLGLHRQLAQPPLLLPHRLLRLLVAPLLRLDLDLQLAHAVLQLLDDLASALHRRRLRLVQPRLQLLHLQPHAAAVVSEPEATGTML